MVREILDGASVMPRDANLSNSYASDYCCFSGLPSLIELSSSELFHDADLFALFISHLMTNILYENK